MIKKVLAIDLGASSGRVMLGEFDGKTIELKEVHRFPNDPVTFNGTMYWDFLRLYYEIRQGLVKSKQHGEIQSLGVDTWGVDFGLLDNDGNLLENPIHYRDNRTSGMVEKSFELIDKNHFYEITGNQFMEINTAFQLLSLSKNRADLLSRAKTALLMPDLFNYALSGEMACEYSIASTTQLLDANKKEWSSEVFDSLDIKKSLFLPPKPSGTKIGALRSDICELLDIKPIDIIAVAGHDTQSALVAVPTDEEDFIFVSCGTWALFGTELLEPIINEDSSRLNITNEGGYDGKISFLKNIIGLWLIQESRRQWIREGKEYSFGHLEDMALNSSGFISYIDPDSPDFVHEGNIPSRIIKYCEKTGQKSPKNESEIMRCIYESLAFKYRMAFDEIKQCTKKPYGTIHMVGGGTKDKLLCQMTANACNCKVISGPVEATVLGNMAIQLMSSGDITNLKQAREIIKSSTQLNVFEPQSPEKWEKEYQRFKTLIK